MDALFDELVDCANKNCGGHFTIMKFATEWRVGFGTPMDRHEIDQMWEGKTFEDAARRALNAAPHPDEASEDMFEQWDREWEEWLDGQCSMRPGL